MANSPSDSDVSAFTDITSSTKDVAIRYLREHPNLENAINAYFDPQTQLSNSWDENAFHSDKTAYGPENQPQASFNVHAQDTLNPAVFDGAVSRPPSRVSNRAFASYGAGSKQPLTNEQEDQDLQKAMAMSMSQTLPGQEMGVTDATGTHFGPATEAYYDNEKWAMTAARSHAQEILHNPDPPFRKREPGAPAFLKPSPAGHYIPSLVTILHSIPIAREALLARDCTLSDYGTGEEWWDGVPIETPRVVTIDDLSNDTEKWDVVFECQRLMAFLDRTERAYGSTDVLANTEGIRGNQGVEPEGGFLDTWSANVGQIAPQLDLHDIFRWNASIDGDDRTFYTLELPLNDELLDCGLTLYDALDDALWAGYNATDPEEIFLQKIGEVLVIRTYRASEEGSGLGIKIPATWFADRYLKYSVAATKEMRLKKDSILRDIKNIETTQAKLNSFQHTSQTSKLVDSAKLLSIAKSHFEASSKNSLTNGTAKSGDLIDVGSESSAISYSKVAEELQAVAERVSQKLKALELSKEQALEKMRELTKLYTRPSETLGGLPHHKYTLRGVSTQPNIIYILANPNDGTDLIDTDLEEWQWWKIKFSSGDARPVSYTKVREIEVLKAAKDESNRVLLVYASETAMSYVPEELPPQLRNFVRADNLAFETELRKLTLPKPATPTKRKAADSYDDLHTDGDVNWGGDHDGYEESPIAMTGLPLEASPYTAITQRPQASASLLDSHRSLSYDESIPIGLRASEHTVDPKSLAYDDVDLLGDIDSGQEMQERSGGVGVLPGSTGPGVGEYTLGSYVPEIEMEDLNDGLKEKAG